MRVVLHAGLHKSGTTSVQVAWRAAYGSRGATWYPHLASQRLSGHHGIVWPLLEAYRTVGPADLEAASRRPPAKRLLDRVLADAAAKGTDTTLISTEELDRFSPADVDRFGFLDDYDVTVLVTVTHPWHRWSSGWQTLVRHGLAEYPADAADHIEAFGSLVEGRLEELLRLLPGGRKIVRVVRTSPPEETLAADLLELVGLRWQSDVVVPAARNRSLGTRVDVLRQLNDADRTTGFAFPGRRILAQTAATVTEWRERGDLAARYQPPARFAEAVAREAAWLRNASADGVEVIDPHGELDGWETDRRPSWYQEISQREAVVPGDVRAADTAEQLWRVRQHRSVLVAEAGRERMRVEAQLADLRRENARLREQVATLERLPLRSFARRLTRLRRSGARS